MLLALLALAQATTLSGESLEVSWNSGGTWNDSAVGTGLRAYLDDAWWDFTYAGTAYQMWAVEYAVGGAARELHANSALGTTVLVDTSEDISDDGRLGTRWTYLTPELTVVKTESFAQNGRAVVVTFSVENRSADPIDDLRLLWAVDPDQDAAYDGNYNTANDVLDTDGDGTDDYAEAVGSSTTRTLAAMGCTPEDLIFGFWSDWQTFTEADAPLTDPDAVASDSAMGLSWWDGESIPGGGTRAWTLIFGVGADSRATYAELQAEADTACCDGDGDGVASIVCGGEDCDDTNPGVLPGAVDEPYDDVDADCAGNDENDLDGDGEWALEAGGRDCDDLDASVATFMAEQWYDGVDQNCDGNDDDQDYDGYPLATDCDDLDPTLFEGCPEPVKNDDEVVSAGACGCTAGASGSAGAAAFAVVGLGVLRRRGSR